MALFLLRPEQLDDVRNVSAPGLCAGPVQIAIRKRHKVALKRSNRRIILRSRHSASLEPCTLGVSAFRDERIPRIKIPLLPTCFVLIQLRPVGGIVGNVFSEAYKQSITE